MNVFVARIWNVPCICLILLIFIPLKFPMPCGSVLGFENLDIIPILLKVKCCNIPKNFSLIIGGGPHLDILKLRYFNTYSMFHGNHNSYYRTLQQYLRLVIYIHLTNKAQYANFPFIELFLNNFCTNTINRRWDYFKIFINTSSILDFSLSYQSHY